MLDRLWRSRVPPTLGPLREVRDVHREAGMGSFQARQQRTRVRIKDRRVSMANLDSVNLLHSVQLSFQVELLRLVLLESLINGNVHLINLRL